MLAQFQRLLPCICDTLDGVPGSQLWPIPVLAVASRQEVSVSLSILKIKLSNEICKVKIPTVLESFGQINSPCGRAEEVLNSGPSKGLGSRAPNTAVGTGLPAKLPLWSGSLIPASCKRRGSSGGSGNMEDHGWIPASCFLPGPALATVST